MKFSELNKLTLHKDEENIMALNKFSNNDENHFYSISSDSSLKEWVFENDFFSCILIV